MSVSPELVPYSVGLVFASVCTSLPDDEATARLNAEVPCGTRKGWTIHDGPFADGTPNPCPCSTDPEVRRHLLFDA